MNQVVKILRTLQATRLDMYLLRVGCQFGKTLHEIFDSVHLFPALCLTIEVGHPGTSLSSEQLSMLGAPNFLVVNQFV